MKPEEVKNEKQEQELQDEELEQAAGGDSGRNRLWTPIPPSGH